MKSLLVKALSLLLTFALTACGKETKTVDAQAVCAAGVDMRTITFPDGTLHKSAILHCSDSCTKYVDVNDSTLTAKFCGTIQ